MIGSYYSQDYADVVCDQYRALGYLTIGIAHELQNGSTQAELLPPSPPTS